MDEDMIDHASGVQPWIQVRDILIRKIAAGDRGIPPPEGLTGALPGERRLAAEFGVSPASLRKAIAALRQAGYIETTRGYGSRVLRPEERPPR